jgi:hypothetical protein
MGSQGATQSRALTYSPNEADIKRNKLLSNRFIEVWIKNDILSKLRKSVFAN